MMLGACSPAPTSSVVEIGPAQELPAPPPPATATVVVQPTPPPVRAMCEPPPSLAGCAEIARVRVGRISLSSPTCFVDMHLATGDIGRLMRCPSGAVVVFGAMTFAGTTDGTSVDACVRTEFPFSDGCLWQSIQRVKGRFDESVSLTYGERAIKGTSCTPSTCRASAPLEVVGVTP